VTHSRTDPGDRLREQLFPDDGRAEHSLKRCAPRLPLHVLDFGMDERQTRFLERHCRLIRRPPDVPAGAFVDMIATRGIARETPYFNTGFIACRSPAIMQAWDALGRATPLHSMFDQNLFNLVLAERGAPVELPARVWNLHGALLNDATLK